MKCMCVLLNKEFQYGIRYECAGLVQGECESRFVCVSLVLIGEVNEYIGNSVLSGVAVETC